MIRKWFYNQFIRRESRLYFKYGKDRQGRPHFHREKWGSLLLWEFDGRHHGTRVYFTTRKGGVSRPPYDSFNLGFHVGDIPADVLRNRETLFGIFGFEISSITSPNQRHSTHILVLEDKSMVGSGATSEESEFDPCDGLATSLINSPVLLHFADCAPVVLTGVGRSGEPGLAVLHAGRVGLVEGIIERGVSLMGDKYGIAPGSLVAAIGPAIGVCCYQVSREIAVEFETRFGIDVTVRKDEGVWLDMHKSAAVALAEAGLLPDKIHALEICTSCNEHFFSYRRDGVTGRHGAIAWIE